MQNGSVAGEVGDGAEAHHWDSEEVIIKVSENSNCES